MTDKKGKRKYFGLDREEFVRVISKTGELARKEAFPKGNPIVYAGWKACKRIS